MIEPRITVSKQVSVSAGAYADSAFAQAGDTFHNMWQTYRTRKNRALPTVSDLWYAYADPGKHTACVKVVDVFGVDTSITVEISI